MKRQIALLSILAVFSLNLFSQGGLIVSSAEDVNKFLKSTTYIVLEDALFSDYNDIVKETIKTHWKITNFKFIKESEFEKYRRDKNSSFLMKNRVYFEKDKTSTKFEFLMLCMGGKYKTVIDMPDICAIPLCYEDDEEDNYLYKLPIFIRFMQNHINMLKENPKMSEKKVIDYYSSKPINLNNRTFYLLQNEVSPEINKPADFENAYSYKYKFSNKEEIHNLIKDNKSEILILHLIGPHKSNSKDKLQYCINIVFDNKTSEIIFYDKHKIDKSKGKYILSSDIKKINKKK